MKYFDRSVYSFKDEIHVATLYEKYPVYYIFGKEVSKTEYIKFLVEHDILTKTVVNNKFKRWYFRIKYKNK